jgi:N utilization substance protein A
LSLAIGKRGQNVRLASELIGAKIDIKSETDVKDEVADALARMLRGAMDDEAPAEEEVFDLASAPGIGPKTAEALLAAGFGTLDALLAASEADLQNVEGVGPKTAKSILEWAREKGAGRREAEESAADSSSAADQDFLAALSRAFAESERKKEEVARIMGDEAAATESQDTTPRDGE